MTNLNVKVALQDLIIRLQDAEKGYKIIYDSTKNKVLKMWMQDYMKQRHAFHQELEKQSIKVGREPEVKTSILGSIHRMFIDLKINLIDDSFESIVNEIERGANVLIQDYQNVLENVTMARDLMIILKTQQRKIEDEINSLVRLKKELLATY